MVQEFNAKLSDFGLAKTGPTQSQTHVTTRVMGTEGYCDPRYIATGELACFVTFNKVIMRLTLIRYMFEEMQRKRMENISEM